MQYPLKVHVFQQNLVFNSLTNCLGPRKLLHSGKVSRNATPLFKILHFLFRQESLLHETGQPVEYREMQCGALLSQTRFRGHTSDFGLNIGD